MPDSAQLRQEVLALRKDRTRRSLNWAVKAWANCNQASVDRFGDIWIADPQAGHWLSDDELESFLAWIKLQPKGRAF